MDLGIAGRTAIVCASSKGLGRACATELARAGCKVVVNGRDAKIADATAAEIRAATGADVWVVAGDLNDPAVRDALFAACPAPDILVNNNGGPPPRDFESITRNDVLAGLAAFLASAARKYARHNVTINSIQPGLFDTDRIKQMHASTPDPAAAKAARTAAIPAQRIGTPEEFGQLCAFLASAHAGYIVGQNILIDGGAFPGAF